MDTADRPNANLPARTPGASPRLPSSIPVAPRELATTAAPPASVSSRMLARGLARHWWRILLVWLILSAPLVYLVHRLIQPTYRALALLQIESKRPDLFAPLAASSDLHGPATYLETEVKTITSQPVLEKAVSRDDIRANPMIRDSEDPVSDLREKLDVTIPTNTHYVQIALESTDAQEASDIVNAVVEAYRDWIKSHGKGANKKHLDDLIAYRDINITPKINETQEKLKRLAKEGDLAGLNPTAKDKRESGEQTPSPTSNLETLEQYKTAKSRLLQTEFELMELEAQYAVKLQEAQEQAAGGGAAVAGVDPNNAQVKEQVKDEFFRDPDVTALVNEIKATEEELRHNEGVAKKGSDPARVAARRHLDGLQQEYEALWRTKKRQIERRLLTPTSAPGAPGAESLAELKAAIDSRKLAKSKLEKKVEESKVDQKTSQKDTVDFQLAQEDLKAYREMDNQVNRRLHELRFSEDKSDIDLRDPIRAVPPKVPSHNKRLRYMAVLPLGVLCAVLGLFLLLEVRAERVGDPDMLSSRVGSEVFALPPLPRVEEPRKLKGPGPEDHIDRFIQRLDHLRFAICGDPHETELGRCVLVTSAIGGEGKTTLAAHLAARCGKAGISTLLVDADLRRASLCPLLDVPEGPGLSDVLRNEAKAEDVAVPVQGGTFYLLKAGTPLQDTSRVLQGRGLAVLLAELRRQYELIIIDSPPILPVPDALILGRWTDGALLAARFDVSRSPQVERARRQLDAAGIPVLGTVINGLRFSDSYYGRYTYSRQRAPQSEPPAAEAESESSPTAPTA